MSIFPLAVLQHVAKLAASHTGYAVETVLAGLLLQSLRKNKKLAVYLAWMLLKRVKKLLLFYSRALFASIYKIT